MTDYSVNFQLGPVRDRSIFGKEKKKSRETACCPMNCGCSGEEQGQIGPAFVQVITSPSQKTAD
jgi:hypothetical protein